MSINYPGLAEDVVKLGVPRKELSLFTGVSYGVLSHWLNGFSALTESNMLRISDAVDVYRGKMTQKTYKKKYNRVHNISL